jgi:glyoxylase-like metal-dependent hydrolase (beta-lactamase superfamily II)
MASMQYDVLSTQPLTSTGNFLDQNGNAIGRARIKTVYAVNGVTAGSVVIRNGATGKVLITVDTAASSTAGYTIIPLPGEGILADDALHGTVTNTTSMTLIYG